MSKRTKGLIVMSIFLIISAFAFLKMEGVFLTEKDLPPGWNVLSSKSGDYYNLKTPNGFVSRTKFSKKYKAIRHAIFNANFELEVKPKLEIKLAKKEKVISRIEHGWRGKYLTARRMKMPEIELLNIEFTENKFYGKIDRSEVREIITKNGGDIWAGDFSGLHLVIFEGMNTKVQQDSVILAVLPQLEDWYREN